MEQDLSQLEERIRSCNKCPLHLSRTRAVPGEGNFKAKIVFVGQGPGDYEDESGRPFVGPAGALLDRLLKNIGLNRKDIWLTNVTRCKPPDGRLPNAGEIKTCAPYLLEDLQLIQPKIVCPLGNMALSLLLRKPSQIQHYRGEAIPTQFYFLFPMLHPAAAMRRSDYMPLVQEDFRKLEAFIASKPVLKPPPGQESLF